MLKSVSSISFLFPGSAEAIRKKLVQHPRFQSAKSVAIYVSMPGELSTRDLLSDMLNRQSGISKICFVPKIMDHKNSVMDMIRIDSMDSLVANKWGILEPSANEPSGLSMQSFWFVSFLIC